MQKAKLQQMTIWCKFSQFLTILKSITLIHKILTASSLRSLTFNTNRFNLVVSHWFVCRHTLHKHTNNLIHLSPQFSTLSSSSSTFATSSQCKSKGFPTKILSWHVLVVPSSACKKSSYSFSPLVSDPYKQF